MTLIERLVRLADLWAAAQGRSVSRLSTIVANDGKAVDRLRDGSKTCTVAMFERFLGFFREPGNWPEAGIPAEAAAILDELEAIATGGEAAVGREMQIDGHALMASSSGEGDRPEWPVESATNGGGNIPSGTEERGAAEADSRRPFALSSATCSTIPEPRRPSPDSPACSAGEAA